MVQSGTEKFKNERDNYIFNAIIYFTTVKIFKNRSGLSEFNFGAAPLYF